MPQPSFRAILTERQTKVDSLVCVGLDPLIEKAPKHLLGGLTHPELGPATLYLWMKSIVDATAPYASMFKPQLAHWEAIRGGVEMLRLIITYIHNNYPDIPVLADSKRVDIDRTQAQYAEAILGNLNADGMNYCGYMGRDTLKSLAQPKFAGRALVGLGRTSNPDAWEVQDAYMASNRCLWQFMVEKQLAWSQEFGVLENAGIVMGAAHKDPISLNSIYSDHLARAREIVGTSMWFLIPGIGTQGGFVLATVRAAYAGPGTIAINSSSGIIFASQGEDFASAAGKATETLRDEIRLAVAAATMASMVQPS